MWACSTADGAPAPVAGTLHVDRRHPPARHYSIYNAGFPPTPFPHMSNAHTADLLALDTETLKGRLSELRRYL